MVGRAVRIALHMHFTATGRGRNEPARPSRQHTFDVQEEPTFGRKLPRRMWHKG